jgi:hypothetical protein
VSQSQFYESYRNPVAQRLPEMITAVQLIICSSFQGTRSCVTVLTTPRHWTLFLVIYLQSTTSTPPPPPPILLRIQLSSPSPYRLYRNRHFYFPFAGQNFFMHFSLLHTCYMSHQSCSPSLKRPNNTSKEYKLLSSL